MLFSTHNYFKDQAALRVLFFTTIKRSMDRVNSLKKLSEETRINYRTLRAFLKEDRDVDLGVVMKIVSWIEANQVK